MHESKDFENLLSQCPFSLRRRDMRPEAIAGDKGYSPGAIRDWLRSRAIKDTIPTRNNEHRNKRFAKKGYRRRNIVERVIGWLKESRRIATRYDKLLVSYLSFVQLAAWRMMLKNVERTVPSPALYFDRLLKRDFYLFRFDSGKRFNFLERTVNSRLNRELLTAQTDVA
jgi:transposase